MPVTHPSFQLQSKTQHNKNQTMQSESQTQQNKILEVAALNTFKNEMTLALDNIKQTDKYKNSVVRLFVSEESVESISFECGTGFFIRPNVIVTCYHVVDMCNQQNLDVLTSVVS